MIHVIGANGLLASSIFSANKEFNLNQIDRATYENWWQRSSIKEIRSFFSSSHGSGTIILIAAGVLDPKASEEEHLRVNYSLPQNIISATEDLGIRVVTFGTVSEHFQSQVNTYIRSKKMLADYILSDAVISKRVTHIRLHTLYGGRAPHEFMFLGRILHSISLQLPFEMTNGNQLREYHDVYDVALAIWEILESGAMGAIDLSHGAPITLKNLAEYLFNRFDCAGLLRLGALEEPVSENYETIFRPHYFYAKTEFRFSLPAIGDYFDNLLSERKSFL